jgi:hypothetical protein
VKVERNKPVPLKPTLRKSPALPKCDLPAHEVLDWCAAMLANDRVGFIARKPLQLLQTQFQAAAAR